MRKDKRSDLCKELDDFIEFSGKAARGSYAPFRSHGIKQTPYFGGINQKETFRCEKQYQVVAVPGHSIKESWEYRIISYPVKIISNLFNLYKIDKESKRDIYWSSMSEGYMRRIGNISDFEEEIFELETLKRIEKIMKKVLSRKINIRLLMSRK